MAVQGLTVSQYDNKIHEEPVIIKPEIEPHFVATNGIEYPPINPGHENLTVSQSDNQAAAGLTSQATPPEKPLSDREKLVAFYRQFDWSQPTVDQAADKILAEKGIVERRNAAVVSTEPSKKTTPLNNVTLGGDILISGGVAFLGEEQHLKVTHRADGHPEKEAHVDLIEGRFGVELNSLEGFLVAELKDAQGDLIGAGLLNLYDIKKSMSSLDQLTHLDLEITPYYQGVNAMVDSALSMAGAAPTIVNASLNLPDLNVTVVKDESGQFANTDFLDASTYLQATTAEGHWPSISFGTTGVKGQIHVFPESLIESLFGLTEGYYDRNEALRAGIIWGRVIENGKPKEGVSVELANSSLKPIYFTSYLPNKNSMTTSKDGMFAFVNVDPEAKIIRVLEKNNEYAVELIPVEAGHVTSLDLVRGQRVSVELSTKNAITQQSVAANVSVVGHKSHWTTATEGRAVVLWPKQKGLSVVEATGPEFTPVRLTVADQRWPHIEVPMVKTGWIEEFLNKYQVNHSSRKAIVVGNVQGGDYRAFINSGSEESKRDIFYFDTNGNLTDRPQNSVGFVIVNVEPGVNSITVVPTDGVKIHTQVVVADTDVVSVLKVNLNQ